MNIRITAWLMGAAYAASCAAAASLTSPDSRIAVTVNAIDKAATYAVTFNGQTVLEPSPLGVVTDKGRWDKDVELAEASAAEQVADRYILAHGKRRMCVYQANRQIFALKNRDGAVLNVVFQVSNDGVALRYMLPAWSEHKELRIDREATGFNLPANTRAWMMAMDEPGSGWAKVNPAYERFYDIDIPATTASPTGVGWAFPTLYRIGDHAWLQLMESGVDGGYCGARLSSPDDEGVFRIDFPPAAENAGQGAAEPTVELPFASPWRVMVIGASPATIVESTLVTDVAPPTQVENADFVKPGWATWSWLPEKDRSTVFERQKDYIDLAVKLGFQYCLVDALWDVQIGEEKLAELARYAADHGVGLLVWYNSNGRWNEAPQTPKNRMHERDVRRREFAKLRRIGVKGVKIDFFGGDKQSTMQLYEDILRDAADFEILVNFHGSTIPRGWERTWPHLMTMEGVRGYEFFTFREEGAVQAAEHATMVPFLRNAIGPMDFTPTCLGPFLNTEKTVKRHTTDACDLAMTVVFESGIQHLGVTPDDIAAAPAALVEWLKALPPRWDDTRFVKDVPGKYVVIARRAGDTWYVGGINAPGVPRNVQLDLSFIGKSLTGRLLGDAGEGAELESRPIQPQDKTTFAVTMQPSGGFALRVQAVKKNAASATDEP